MMKQLDHLTRRRKMLAYFGLGLTGVALKGCSLPSTIEAANTKPIVNATLETSTEIARNTNGKSLPEFTGVQEWLNSSPLTIADLKGKVVLIHIWTFACINCQRTLPYVVKWHEQYAKQGLKVVGIHTPEFPFERDINQVKSALSKHRITYPNAIDNRHQMWSAYDNQYWPHLFLADRRGIIQYDHIGEGAYDKTEQKIRQLLG
jgi:thiol-disulfide isomerase/thioredoxin